VPTGAGAACVAPVADDPTVTGAPSGFVPLDAIAPGGAGTSADVEAGARLVTALTISSNPKTAHAARMSRGTGFRFVGGYHLPSERCTIPAGGGHGYVSPFPPTHVASSAIAALPLVVGRDRS
jgi:hypothetical protein